MQISENVLVSEIKTVSVEEFSSPKKTQMANSVRNSIACDIFSVFNTHKMPRGAGFKAGEQLYGIPPDLFQYIATSVSIIIIIFALLWLCGRYV